MNSLKNQVNVLRDRLYCTSAARVMVAASLCKLVFIAYFGNQWLPGTKNKIHLSNLKSDGMIWKMVSSDIQWKKLQRGSLKLHC